MPMFKGCTVLLALLCLAGTAAAMGSTHYDLSWNVIGGGGGAPASASYAMGGTVGQIPGIADSTDHVLYAGFWVPESGGLPPQKGKLAVNSTPEGADILLNGADSGLNTNATLELDPGIVTVSVEKYCYLPPDPVEVTIVAGSPVDVEFILVPDVECNPAKGRLHVTSDPAGATILLDGADSGETTEFTFELDPGVVTVGVEKYCYLTPDPVEATIVADETIDIAFLLEPDPDPACASPVPEFPTLLVPVLILAIVAGTIFLVRRIKD